MNRQHRREHLARDRLSNSRMDLTVAVAAQRGRRPRGVLKAPAAQAPVSQM